MKLAREIAVAVVVSLIVAFLVKWIESRFGVSERTA